MNISVID